VHALSAEPHCVGGFGEQPGGNGIAPASLQPTETEPPVPDCPDAPPVVEPLAPPVDGAPPAPPVALEPPALLVPADDAPPDAVLNPPVPDDVPPVPNDEPPVPTDEPPVPNDEPPVSGEPPLLTPPPPEAPASPPLLRTGSTPVAQPATALSVAAATRAKRKTFDGDIRSRIVAPQAGANNRFLADLRARISLSSAARQLPRR
jgi:hypothetical protein